MATPLQGMQRIGPSHTLASEFRACSRDSTEAVWTILRNMLHVFMQHPQTEPGHGSNRTNEMAARISCKTQVLFYNILEATVTHEKKRLRANDISGTVGNELFIRSLVAVCLEMVLFDLSLPGGFPALLHLYNLPPYHFYGVIELLLRADDSLRAAVVRHLALVEEQVVEMLAWTNDSPLWQSIRDRQAPLPGCQQVMLPKYFEDPNDMVHNPGQTCPDHPAGDTMRPQRKLCLFLRKVYSLMSRRLSDLCSRLIIGDELRLKIWTCFEHSLVHCTQLMLDRHLDQLLMCAVYVMCRITKTDITFKHIMRCYKTQPYGSKNVCRNVLISRRIAENYPAGNSSESFPTPNTPSMRHLTADQEERGNLIYFYNNVYVSEIRPFAVRFSPSPQATAGEGTPPLTPFPRQEKGPPPRRRPSRRHSLYITPLNTDGGRSAPPSPSADPGRSAPPSPSADPGRSAPPSPTADPGHSPPPGSSAPSIPSSPSTYPRVALNYYFCRSSPKCLQEINTMIKASGRKRSARPLQREEEENRLEEAEEEEEEGLPALKRPRPLRSSAFQNRLETVFSDRGQRLDQLDG